MKPKRLDGENINTEADLVDAYSSQIIISVDARAP